MSRREKGQQFETFARHWLEKRGLSAVAQNYNCRHGEIDLVMLESDCLCFIEVKYRNSLGFGGSAYSLPVSKQRKITRAAQHFIDHHRHYRNHAMRFDAVLLQGMQGSEPQVNWIRDAFPAADAG
jgi:putative endonuclease